MFERIEVQRFLYLKSSDLENHLAFQLDKLEIPYAREYKFARELVGAHPKGIRARLKEASLKDWRFDFAWPEEKLAVEVEGGVFINGAHTRGAKYSDDCDKYNAALMAGWRVLRFTTKQVKNGRALELIQKALNGRRVEQSIFF